MMLYLDEDIGSHHVAQALQKAGHDAAVPGDIGMRGKSDVVQFTYAAKNDRVLVTGNHRDFEDLHDLIAACGGSHPGILTIRKDNDRRRDRKPNHVVAAINNIAGMLSAVQNRFICLNDWR